MDDELVHERVARAESLLLKLEAMPDPKARAVAMEAVQALLELYGEGLARMMAALERAGGVPRTFADDELVAHLLLLHGLHPHDVETRLRAALREAQGYLASQGGTVSLLGVEGSVVRLRLANMPAKGCGSVPNNASLRDTVEQVVLAAAPEVTRIEMEGDDHAPLTAAGGFIPLGNLIEVDVHG